MQIFNIQREHIKGLPSLPYRKGEGAYEGVVSHCTDSENHHGGDTPHGEAAYESRTWSNAFVHYFVGIENGAVVVLETADPNYKAYGAGPQGNGRFVHVEFCMYDDATLFARSYDAYCWLLADILYRRSLGVTAAKADGTGTLWSHDDVRRFLGGTTHTDPIAYLKAHGITWDEHVAYVARYYNFIYEQKHPKPAPQPKKPTQEEIDMEKIAELEKRIAALEIYPCPAWAKPAIDAAVKCGAISDPVGTHDFYRVIATLYNKGFFK